MKAIPVKMRRMMSARSAPDDVEGSNRLTTTSGIEVLSVALKLEMARILATAVVKRSPTELLIQQPFSEQKPDVIRQKCVEQLKDAATKAMDATQ